ALVAADARRAAGFTLGPDGQGVPVPAQRDARAKPIVCIGVRGLDVRLLGPCPTLIADKDVDRAGRTCAVVALVAVDAGRLAVFTIGPNGQGVPVPAQRDARAELL